MENKIIIRRISLERKYESSYKRRRYADDMLLFAKTREELEKMLGLFIEELQKIGLDLNASKTKIITNDIHLENFITIGDETINIIEEDGKHKYLGRYISGVLENRSNFEIAHRIQCGWHKCGKCSSTLTNKNVCVKLRLKLFDSTVSPNILFGLCALPISQQNMSKIMEIQRKMLRKIVGWVRHVLDEWETTMRNMKVRVTTAMRQYYVRPWDSRIVDARQKNFNRIMSMGNTRWEKLSMDWEPSKLLDSSQEFVAHRRVGRPCLKWTDNIEVNKTACPYSEIVSIPPLRVVPRTIFRNSPLSRLATETVVPLFVPSTDAWW